MCASCLSQVSTPSTGSSRLAAGVFLEILEILGPGGSGPMVAVSLPSKI